MAKLIELARRNVQHSGADTQVTQLRSALQVAAVLFPNVGKANSPAPLRVSCWICRFWLNSQYPCFLSEIALVRFVVRSPPIQTNRPFICQHSSNFCANTEVVSVPSMPFHVPYSPTWQSAAERCSMRRTGNALPTCSYANITGNYVAVKRAALLLRVWEVPSLNLDLQTGRTYCFHRGFAQNWGKSRNTLNKTITSSFTIFMIIYSSCRHSK